MEALERMPPPRPPPLRPRRPPRPLPRKTLQTPLRLRHLRPPGTEMTMTTMTTEGMMTAMTAAMTGTIELGAHTCHEKHNGE